PPIVLTFAASAPTGGAASAPTTAASAPPAGRAETAAEAGSAAAGTIGTAVSTTDPRLPPAIATVLAAAGASGATAETRARFTATGPASRAAATTTSTAATAPTTSTAAAVTATGDSVVADPASAGVTTVSGETVVPGQDGAAIPSSDPARSAAAPSQAATATSAATTRAAPVATDGPGDPDASAGDEAVAVRDRTAKASAPAIESAERSDAADTTASAAEPPAPPMVADGGRDRPLAMAPVADAGRGEASSEADRAVSLPHFAEAVAERSRSGHSRFDIRLSPAELGGVDVRIEVRSSGEVRAHLVVERTETLDLMLRDQRQLERSLTDAGLDVSSSGLQFSLKEQASGWGDQGRRAYEELADRGAVASAPTDEESATAAIAAFAQRPARAGGIDLRV
ncbi:MAG: flagellar hook-length control protein FliK, partial [Siculibacillus sp.]|nr:flagellar hook-length control protein FliK [Siculibacillus sp.]